MDFNNIFTNLKFKNITKASYADILDLYKIRNNEIIRSKMFNKNFITRFNHNKWFIKIKNNSNEDFFLIYYKEILCGGLGIKNVNSKLKECDWAFFISNNSNFPGLGASIEFKSINFLFKKYGLHRLYCYVLKENQSVINLHKKFFFLKVPVIESKLKNYNINISKNNVIKFCLNLKEWKSESKILKEKFKIDEKKIYY